MTAKQHHKKLTTRPEFIRAYFGDVGLPEHKDLAEDSDRAETKITGLTYQGTECGAWFRFTDGGVSVGSIVEGVDMYAETQTLEYPFTMADYWQALKLVEESADEIWMMTHGCVECYPDVDPETGYGRVNPECKLCGGEGVMI